jgi:hypothetical protein
MSYSVYVSAAQEFLPAFYRRLFNSGHFADAARAGRQQLVQKKVRIGAAGPCDLDDWVVPVVYELHPLDFSFTTTSSPYSELNVPEEIADSANPYGLIGRDGAIVGVLLQWQSSPATGILGLGESPGLSVDSVPPRS